MFPMVDFRPSGPKHIRLRDICVFQGRFPPVGSELHQLARNIACLKCSYVARNTWLKFCMFEIAQ